MRFLIAASFFSLTLSSAWALHFGREVPLADNPAVIGFESMADAVPSPANRCSAVRIAEKTYLSAAHCFDLEGIRNSWKRLPEEHPRKQKVVVRLKQGTSLIDYRELTVEVKKVFMHPQADNRIISKDNPDVAIFVVAEDFIEPAYATLISRPPNIREEVLLTGYGISSEMKCVVGDAQLDKIERVVIRTNRLKEGQANIRLHDSGAGVFSRAENGQIGELMAINSWQRTRVTNPFARGLPPISYHVRIDYVREWIDKVLRSEIIADFNR